MPEALAAFNSPDHFYAARLARKSLDRAEACIPQAPFMIDLYMIAAVDRRVLGQFDEAVKLYERALDYDRRPELYLQLGLTELELNRRAEARKALEKAVLFAPSMLNEISDPEMHSSLSRIVADAAHTRRNEKRPVREGTGLRDE
jgi:tetratricopeptide (TPR) repeat protein